MIAFTHKDGTASAVLASKMMKKAEKKTEKSVAEAEGLANDALEKIDNVWADALSNNVFVETDEALISSTSITAWGVNDSEVSITKAGYYPLAISGLYSSTRYFVTTQCYLKDQAVGSAKIDYMIYNANSSDRTGTVSAHVLWLKAN